MTISARVRAGRNEFGSSVFAEFGRSVVTFATAAVRLEVDGSSAATFLPRVPPVKWLSPAEGAAASQLLPDDDPVGGAEGAVTRGGGGGEHVALQVAQFSVIKESDFGGGTGGGGGGC